MSLRDRRPCATRQPPARGGGGPHSVFADGPTRTRCRDDDGSPSAVSSVMVIVGKSTGETPAHKTTSSPSLKVPIATRASSSPLSSTLGRAYRRPVGQPGRVELDAPPRIRPCEGRLAALVGHEIGRGENRRQRLGRAAIVRARRGLAATRMAAAAATAPRANRRCQLAAELGRGTDARLGGGPVRAPARLRSRPPRRPRAHPWAPPTSQGRTGTP